MSPDHGSSRSRRGVWSHWVPLAVTLTVATVGVAAWVWSQRKDEDEEAEHLSGLDYANADYVGDHQVQHSRDIGAPEKPPRPDEQTQGIAPGEEEVAGTGWGIRGALRRTPSPQQFFDSTGKTVAAGVAAASAAMGKALASIREEDKSPYSGESNPWSEEADAKQVQEREVQTPASPSAIIGGKKRKTVAIVVSADSQSSFEADDGFHEHASILSHIPRHNDFTQIKLFVLIYAPGLKDTTTDTATSNLPPPSLSSSFSNIGHDQVTPGEESKNPLTSSSPAFNSVYSEALGLVEKETMVLPFTTLNGHVHILRHLQPEVIYLQESLSGDEGSVITSLQTWLRHDVILVVGADGGSGGLADSESEAERATKSILWWQRTERVGRGRGIVVVDGMRVNDDWTRRVQGQE
ncbi:hypothetical protein EDB81DRAFT_945994 [Dactylonectria macrodidyma]|uniref:Peroxin 22-like protein n=1 Tax=Dactylonectria macrodidyma TaxID=307937 RepID=A0A9P9F6A3_9HYPO|nr:hypothetical protein EDB81DRAFT_945994 [Dactylonectria macrodidyma]